MADAYEHILLGAGVVINRSTGRGRVQRAWAAEPDEHRLLEEVLDARISLAGPSSATASRMSATKDLSYLIHGLVDL
jgi:hypothetical protein